jgi:hypothetical protein
MKMLKFVDWSEETMNDYEKARDKLTSFIDSNYALIEDPGKVQWLKDEKTLWEIKLYRCQIVLDGAVKQVQMLRECNHTLISCMTPECARRARNRIIAEILMKTTTETITHTQAKLD